MRERWGRDGEEIRERWGRDEEEMGEKYGKIRYSNNLAV
jgi:hypothetical protein